MKILIAEDDPVSRRLLQAALIKWGYEVIVTTNGKEAWETLQQPEAPSLLVMDWLMPEMDGVEVCRQARENPALKSAYIILLTSVGGKHGFLVGMKAGADDFINKPFDEDQLAARLGVAERILNLQSQVKQLSGMLPICSHCKKVRDDQNYWQRLDSYLMEHSEVQFSHGICPDCYKNIVQSQLAAMKPGDPLS